MTEGSGAGGAADRTAATGSHGGGYAPRSLELERLTSPEVAETLERGWRRVVVAFGAVEQHGPHLPLFVDAEHGTAVARAVARRMGRTLVAPTVRVGCSDHHLAFPGSLSLRASTLVAVARDYCASLGHHGFRKICLIPSHGGNFSVLADALEGLDDAAGEDCSVKAFTDLTGLIGLWTRVAAATEDGLGERVGGHADVAETSLMLVLHPELVREERARKGYTGPVDGAFLERALREGFDTVTESGILGDARGASAALGRRLLEEEAALLADRFAGAASED